MNEQDKEAFEKYFKIVNDVLIKTSNLRYEDSDKWCMEIGWKSALEYERENNSPNEAYIKMLQDTIEEYKEAARSEADEVNRLQAENKKLREALEKAHDDFTKQGLHKQASRVLLALNITTDREALKKMEKE